MNHKQNVKVAIRVVTPTVTISVELEQSPGLKPKVLWMG